MTAFTYDIQANQGESNGSSSPWTDTVTWSTGTPPTPIDLTGCSAVLHARSETASPNLLLNLSTAAGSIALGGTAGTIKLWLFPNVAASLAAAWTQAVYNLDVTFPDGTVRRVMQGRILLSPSVVR